MNIICSPRQSGKTTRMIEVSAKTGCYIVVHSVREAERVHRVAQENGYKIPFPLTYDEFIERKYSTAGVKNVAIDNAELLLQYIAGLVKVEAISINDG